MAVTSPLVTLCLPLSLTCGCHCGLVPPLLDSCGVLVHLALPQSVNVINGKGLDRIGPLARLVTEYPAM